MNTHVNFETAKLLKEKGFGMDNSLDDIYLAPTIAEVAMWFYKTHDIWIVPSYELNIEDHKREWFWSAIKGGEEVAYQFNDFNSPTEAYEAAIEYTLKHLI